MGNGGRGCVENRLLPIQSGISHHADPEGKGLCGEGGAAVGGRSVVPKWKKQEKVASVEAIRPKQRGLCEGSARIQESRLGNGPRNWTNKEGKG